MEKSKNEKSKMLVSFLAIFLAVSLVGFYQLVRRSGNSQEIDNQLTGEINLIQLEDVSESRKNRKICNENGCVPDVVFYEIPPMPEDFTQVYEMVYYNKIKLLEDLSYKAPDEAYYKQPEFFPTFRDQCLSEYYTYLDCDMIEVGSSKGYCKLKNDMTFGYLGKLGFSAYPREILIKGIKPKQGEWLELVSFLHSGCFIVTYQGIGLSHAFPTSGETDGGRFIVNQDPQEIRDYFQLELEKNTYLLEPTFPMFKDGWSQKIKAKIHIDEKTPPGKYLITITATNPPEKINEEWLKRYQFNYVPIESLGLGTGDYLWYIFLEVV